MSTFIKRIATIEKLKEEQKELASMLDDAMENSQEYQEAKTQKKAVLSDMNVVKARILNEPGNAKLSDKLKEIRQELSEEKSFLAQELAIFFSKEGKSEIELPDGKIFRFKLSATISERER